MLTVEAIVILYYDLDLLSIKTVILGAHTLYLGLIASAYFYCPMALFFILSYQISLQLKQINLRIRRMTFSKNFTFRQILRNVKEGNELIAEFSKISRKTLRINAESSTRSIFLSVAVAME